MAFSFSSQNMAPSRTLGYTFFRSSVQEKEFWTRRGASRQGPRPGATALALLPQLGRVRDPGPQSPRFLLPDSPPDSASARTRPRLSPVQTDTRAGRGHLGLRIHTVLPEAAATSAPWTKAVGSERQTRNMAAGAKPRPRPLGNPPTVGPAPQKGCPLSGPNS